MYLCDLTFPSLARAGETYESAHELAERLVRSGQFVGDYVVGIIGEDVRISGVLPLPTSFDERFHTEYVRDGLADLESRSGEPVRVKVHSQETDHEPAHLSSLDEIEQLVLRTRYNRLVSPLWDPVSDGHLPMHLVPLSADDRERVIMWERVQKTLDRAWFHAPTEELELAAHRERAWPSSAGIREGRDHARMIEEALGVPVYVWLEHDRDLDDALGEPVGSRDCERRSFGRRPGTDDLVLFVSEQHRLVSDVAFRCAA
ncbi:MAG: DUF2310 family Zn-ribbon-containing protein [Planctomycetota bacterium]